MGIYEDELIRMRTLINTKTEELYNELETSVDKKYTIRKHIHRIYVECVQEQAEMLESIKRP